MTFVKICTDCGYEFETDEQYSDILKCPKCGSGEIDQTNEEE